MVNTSPVSFRFSLRIPGDHAERREFEIQPSKDVINKGEQRPIKVLFLNLKTLIHLSKLGYIYTTKCEEI